MSHALLVRCRVLHASDAAVVMTSFFFYSFMMDQFIFALRTICNPFCWEIPFCSVIYFRSLEFFVQI